MAIAQVAGRFAQAYIEDPATNGNVALAANVTAGNRIIVVLAKLLSLSGGDDPVVGDFSKNSGTATIGAFTLDRVRQNNYDAGDSYVTVAIASAPVTGSGSLTINFVTNAAAGQYTFATVDEYSSIDSGAPVEVTNGGSSAPGAPSTPASSGNGTSAGGALFYGAMVFAGGAATITQDGAFTLDFENESASNTTGGVIHRIVTSGTTDSADWTLGTAQNWAAALVVYKEAAAGGPASPVLARRIFVMP